MANNVRVSICYLIGVIFIQYVVCLSEPSLPMDLEQHKMNLNAAIHQIFPKDYLSPEEKTSVKELVGVFIDVAYAKLQDCMKGEEATPPEESVTTSRPAVTTDSTERSCRTFNTQGKCVKTELCNKQDIIMPATFRSASSIEKQCESDEVCCGSSPGELSEVPDNVPQPVAKVQCGKNAECVRRGMCNPVSALGHQNCDAQEICCPFDSDVDSETPINSCGPNRVCVNPSLCRLSAFRSISLQVLQSNCTSPEVCCRREDELKCGQFTENSGKFPWTVSIQKDNAEIAVGTLISNQVVVTTADAVFESDASQLQVLHMGNNSPQTLKVETIRVHENFKQFLLPFNNIALLKLSQPFNPSPFLAPICLVEDTLEINPEDCKLSTQLEEKQHIITSSKDCEAKLRNLGVSDFGNLVRNSSLCTEGAGDVDASTPSGNGSPLVCRINYFKNQYALIGLASADSWNLQRPNPELPGIYANVPNFYEWINNARLSF